MKVYIAAFAISGYATAQYRNRYKPFNPVLGETFECIREDRGFRYISEQVLITTFDHTSSLLPSSCLLCGFVFALRFPIIHQYLRVMQNQTISTSGRVCFKACVMMSWWTVCLNLNLIYFLFLPYWEQTRDGRTSFGANLWRSCQQGWWMWLWKSKYLLWFQWQFNSNISNEEWRFLIFGLWYAIRVDTGTTMNGTKWWRASTTSLVSSDTLSTMVKSLFATWKVRSAPVKSRLSRCVQFCCYLTHFEHIWVKSLCKCRNCFFPSPSQSRYWGSDGSKNEVQGQVLDESGNVVHRFGGFWHEGIFCDTLPNPQCIWKPS